jgi:transposase InsO family protein
VLKKRGPRTKLSDADLLAKMRELLAEPDFLGEGYRKLHARLRFAGVRVSRERVRRLMREHGLQAPVQPRRELGPRVHDGTIITERPDELWGIDGTSTDTLEDGQVTIFVAVDHCTAECVGIHAAKPATRFEALEVIRQGVRSRFGGFAAEVAAGLKLRHDHGSQFISDAFQEELRFLGIESSPSFVRSPEGNGCVERFNRTLKEQLLWVRRFRNVEELRLALVAWSKKYNERWIIERHGYLTPVQAREQLARKAA